MANLQIKINIQNQINQDKQKLNKSINKQKQIIEQSNQNLTLQIIFENLTLFMYTQIFGISSALLFLFLVWMGLKRLYHYEQPFSSSSQYHSGCFSTDNEINRSISIRQYLSQINTQNQLQIAYNKSFELAHRVDYNEISKNVAKDFEQYLNEYYQLKTKNIYEQSFYKSLNQAQENYKNCKAEVTKDFDKQKFNQDWNDYLESKNKYDALKNKLEQKISRKQQHERKLSYFILDTNYSDSDQYQKNITNQINELNNQLQNLNTRKIQLLNKKSPVQVYLVLNQTKLEQDQKLYDECIKNMKIITFCNQLTKELNTIKLTFTKQDIQTKIQRKKFIIDSFKNAIRNAQKTGDQQMVSMSKKNLYQNQRQLQLLQVSIESFESYEQSYCSKCSDQKIQQLKVQIQRVKLIIQQLTQLRTRYDQQQEQLFQKTHQATRKIVQLQQQRDIEINSHICITPQCQQQRSRNISEMGKILNQMKREVLQQQFNMELHKLEHAEKIQKLNKWTTKLSQVIDCLNNREYYQQLRERKPDQSEENNQYIQKLESKLVQKLEALGPWQKID